MKAVRKVFSSQSPSSDVGWNGQVADSPPSWVCGRNTSVQSCSSSAFPARSLGFANFGDFCVRDRFNSTIEVVTINLRRWCMLGVFLLPAVTRLGLECQDLLSPYDEMHVCTD